MPGQHKRPFGEKMKKSTGYGLTAILPVLWIVWGPHHVDVDQAIRFSTFMVSWSILGLALIIDGAISSKK